VWQHARCGGILINHFTANLPENFPVEEFCKSVKISQKNYGRALSLVCSFLAHPVRVVIAFSSSNCVTVETLSVSMIVDNIALSTVLFIFSTNLSVNLLALIAIWLWNMQLLCTRIRQMATVDLDHSTNKKVNETKRSVLTLDLCIVFVCVCA